MQSEKALKKEQNMKRSITNSIMPKKVLNNLMGQDDGMFSAPTSNTKQFRELKLGQYVVFL